MGAPPARSMQRSRYMTLSRRSGDGTSRSPPALRKRTGNRNRARSGTAAPSGQPSGAAGARIAKTDRTRRQTPCAPPLDERQERDREFQPGPGALGCRSGVSARPPPVAGRHRSRRRSIETRLCRVRNHAASSRAGGTRLTSRFTGLWSVLATGDQSVACLMSASRLSTEASASIRTETRTASNPDGLRLDVTGSPDRCGVDIGLEFQFEPPNRGVACDHVGMDADREAGAEGGQESLGRVRGDLFAQQAVGLAFRHRLRRQVPDVVQLGKATPSDRSAPQGADGGRVRLGPLDQGVEFRLGDWCEDRVKTENRSFFSWSGVLSRTAHPPSLTIECSEEKLDQRSVVCPISVDIPTRPAYIGTPVFRSFVAAIHGMISLSGMQKYFRRGQRSGRT